MIKELLIKLVIEAYKRGYRDCELGCNADEASLKEMVEEILS